jgi:hypothetical protein
MTPPLVIIDAANVVGSVPDGWWKDRAGATERLRDNLADLPTQRLGTLDPPLDVVMVVEGKARDIAPSDSIRVISAPGSGSGSGDDAIVDLVRSEIENRPHVVVVTADRGLRTRVTSLGATTLGPSSVR